MIYHFLQLLTRAHIASIIGHVLGMHLADLKQFFETGLEQLMPFVNASFAQSVVDCVLKFFLVDFVRVPCYIL